MPSNTNHQIAERRTDLQSLQKAWEFLAMPTYTVTETHTRESADIHFARLIRMLQLVMSLKRPEDEVYRRARALGRAALDYLDVRDYLQQS